MSELERKRRREAVVAEWRERRPRTLRHGDRARLLRYLADRFGLSFKHVERVVYAAERAI